MMTSNTTTIASVCALLLGVAAPLSMVGCDAECLALPACEAGEEELPDCEGVADCREVSACGTTIGCRTQQATCLALPVCNAGEEELPNCEGVTDCREVSLCGTTIGCRNKCPGAVNLQCEADEIKVDTCPQGETCREVTACNLTIYCVSKPKGCMDAAGCSASEFCQFSDGKCGRGVQGTCEPRPNFCSDGPSVCTCDGTIVPDSGFGCPGFAGHDLDREVLACKLSSTQFSCGPHICDSASSHYCQLTTSDVAGQPDSGSCFGGPVACSPVNCACLTAETAACGGKCADGATGPTITCPGG